ncbi:PREDICTED: serine--tRNA ligase, mitochondrial isoform X1 [Polistes dominula]|uniref:serine--tRNA ligase n=1 Tax=Polistes dominula TaxID=743375 RepID=A0ABM1I381_POLDO|nr:PREDICTED: serine--tRNA ligase, mitochondrial isoform X1 [Polistes dominula]
MNFKNNLRQFFIEIRRFYTQYQKLTKKNFELTKLCMPEPEYNVKFLCDPLNRDYIANNVKKRKGVGDIDKVLELFKQIEKREMFLNELSKIPNDTYSSVFEYGDKPHVLKVCGSKREYNVEPKDFSYLAKKLKLMRSKGLGPIMGSRCYVFQGELAELENALIRYTLKKLIKHGFQLVSVPDIIPTEIIKRCGLLVDGPRTLVYNLSKNYGDDYSLSGTAEMSLAAKLINSKFSYKDLPLKMTAISRCYRAEISSTTNEKGIYRVHQFTKVEMFVCSEQNKSSEVFQYLLDIQEDLFSSLGLHFKILDMPAHELGAPAYRKVDMDGWMPGRKLFGELSSCSNCTDYQSRRLNIKYQSPNGELLHVHTLNGTACAIPRMMIALCETHQTEHGRIKIPEPLVPFMDGKTLIRKQPVALTSIYN